MSTFVLDASVVIKWFIPEVHSAAARRLLEGVHNYFAPDLLFAEVGNAFWKKVQLGQLIADDAQEFVTDLSEINVETLPCRTLAGDAHALAVATGRTVYDMMYLALTLRLKAQLITADERLYNALIALPMTAPHIRLLTRFDSGA